MIETLLKQDEINLIFNLRNLILSNPNKALNIIQELELSKRFNKDDVFRCAVLIEKISAYTFLGKHEYYIDIINDVYEEARRLNNNTIFLEACVRLGSAYSTLGNLKTAIELYNNAYQHEKRIDRLTNYSATACANLGVFYHDYGKTEEGSYYYNITLNILDDIIDFNNPDHNQLITYITVLSNLSMVMVKKKEVKLCKEYLNKIENVLTDDLPNFSIIAYQRAKLFYYIVINDDEKLITNIKKILLSLYQQNNYSNAVTLLLDLSRLIKDNDHLYERLMLCIINNLDIIGEKAIYYNELQELYVAAMKYAIENNENQLIINYYKKLKKITKKTEKEINKQKSQSIDFFIELAKQKQQKNLLIRNNKKLNKTNLEKRKRNQKLKYLHDQLRIITNIGQKITAASTLKDIESKLHEELAEIVPISSIALFAKQNDTEYISAYIYDRGDIQNNVVVNVSNQNSLTAKVINTEKKLISNDLQKEEYFK